MIFFRKAAGKPQCFRLASSPRMRGSIVSKRWMPAFVGLTLGLLGLIIMFGGLSSALADTEKLPVIASFSIIGDMVQQVGGDAVEVRTLVGADSDAHSYQPTPDDAKAVASAKIIFINGLGFEGWIRRLIEASGTKAKVITVSTGVKARANDPHAWQSVSNGRIYARNIAKALDQERPAQAASIEARAQKYDAQLEALDRQIKTEFAAIPVAQRKIITSHDAFGYFGEAYGIRFLSPEGLSTESEPSAFDVSRLIEQIKTEHIKQVFMENMNNPKLLRQIALDSGAVIGGTLYSDALSKPEGSAPTYVKMFENNVPKLKAAMVEAAK